MYGAVPPVIVTSIDPVEAPKHASVTKFVCASAVGSDMTTLLYVSSQLDIPSEAVTVYVPAGKPVTSYGKLPNEGGPVGVDDE